MSAARKIENLYPRAPRYVIEVGDNEVVRFSYSPRGSRAMHTRIINLSESGMAFLVPYMSAPKQDEQIKVEFTAPNSDSIACFARVTRMETHKTYHQHCQPQVFKLVAVEFINLHPQQRKMLADGLHLQVKKKYEKYQNAQRWTKLTWFFLKIWQNLTALPGLLLPFRRSRSSRKNDQSSKIRFIDL